MKLTPVTDTGWIRKECGQLLKQLYTTEFLKVRNFRNKDIMPEHLAKWKCVDVELLVAMLARGAWIDHENWETVVRYTIAKRLKQRASILFQPPFDKIKDKFQAYQLNGADFNTQKQLSQVARTVVLSGLSTPVQRATAKLIASTIDDVRLNTLIQPFHWIRVAVAASDPVPALSLSLYESEMRYQKQSLCQILRADLRN